jgi:uncharacterized protein (TIGR03067 family)
MRTQLRKLLPVFMLTASLQSYCLAEEPARLDGIWEISSVEHRGQPIDEEQYRLTYQGMRWYINGQSLKLVHVKLVHGRSKGPIWNGTYELDDTQTPAHFDWTLLAGDEKRKVLGVYERKDNVLRICKAGIGRPRPTSFDTSEDGTWTLYEFQRVADDNAKSD